MNIQPELTDSWLEEAKVNCDTLREVAEYIAQRAAEWALSQPVSMQQRIAELEVEVKRTSLTRIQRECLRIGEEVQRAAGELPDGYDIHIEIERGAGAVYLSNPSYDVTHFNDTVDGISHCITQAIDAAIAEVKP